MSPNNNFAYHVLEKKSYLAWYHPTTSRCKQT